MWALNRVVHHELRRTPCRLLILAFLGLVSIVLSGCGGGGDQGSVPAEGANRSAAATATPRTVSGIAPILLFNGTGTSPEDVAAVETILNNNQLNYSTANSLQLNESGESQIRGYRLLIVPEGQRSINTGRTARN